MRQTIMYAPKRRAVQRWRAEIVHGGEMPVLAPRIEFRRAEHKIQVRSVRIASV